MRRPVPSWLIACSLPLLVSVAAAEPRRMTASGHEMVGVGGPCVIVPVGPETAAPALQAALPHAGQISPILYLERCRGGCTVHGGNTNDSRTMTSMIAPLGDHQFPEFTNFARESGAAADAEWNAIVDCVREAYSWYDVQVTDVKPPGGTSYHLNLVSGAPAIINLDPSTLGIAPFSCTPIENSLSYSFAGVHGASDSADYVKRVCWTIAHEAGHSFTLEHAFEFLDGRSACNDPMTYDESACHPYRYFRNEPTTCGGFNLEPCRCSSTQTSHQKLINVFGAGTTTVEPPTVALLSPEAGGLVGAVIEANAGSRRGVAKVELIVNGYKWADVKGAAFGRTGQANPAKYNITVPLGLPNSIVDIVIRACDDLGVCTESPKVTATKGAACTSADSCAKGQKCEQGKCFWEPPSGQVGDDCTFPQFCLSGLCQGTAEQSICTQECIPGSTGGCPDDLTCVDAGGGKGICFPPAEESGGGCCSVGGESSGGAPWVHGGLAALMLGLLVRPRRRR